jgi:hypothetical protein
MRVREAWPNEAPPVVLVDMVTETTVAALAKTVTKILQAKPKAIALDFGIPNDLADGIVDPLVEVLKGVQLPVAIPLMNKHLAVGVGANPWVRDGTPILFPDEDGRVRSTQERACIDTPTGGGETRPTLAGAIVNPPAPFSYGCKQTIETRPILFAPTLPVGGKPAEGVLLLPAETLPNAPLEDGSPLTGAYVVVGHAGPESTDAFMTPVGSMGGALVHAQAVRTFANPQPAGFLDLVVNSWFKPVFEFILSLITGALFAVINALRPPKLRIRPEQPRKLLRGLYDFYMYFMIPWAVAGIVLVVVGIFLTWLAAIMVGHGEVIGAYTAIFSSMLETLVHYGWHLVKFAEWIAEPLIDGFVLIVTGRFISILKWWPSESRYRVVPLFFLAGTLAPASAKAQDCIEQIGTVTGSLAAVHINSNSSSVQRLPVTLKPFDRVIVDQTGTTVVLEQLTQNQRIELAPLKGAEPPLVVSLVVPPCPPVPPGWVGVWNAFWSPLTVTAPQPQRSGSTPMYRAFGHVTPPKDGPLRVLQELAPATGVVPGATGLALAWVGGTPPYSVSVSDAAGKPLLAVKVPAASLWLPDWRAPDQAFTVLVQDAKGLSFTRQLMPLAPAAIADGELGDAIVLFQTAPAYRLEALRRLEVRASAGDALAQKAVESIQHRESAE